MKTLIVLAILTGLLLAYAVWGRSWLKSKEWAQPFFAWIEPYEIFLFKKSETILAARTLTVLGGMLTFLSQIGDINLSPIMPFVPDKYQGIVNIAVNCLPLTISALGWMVEKLRSKVTKPLELVAVAEKDITPEVAEVIKVAETAKAEAVQIVAEAKAV